MSIARVYPGFIVPQVQDWSLERSVLAFQSAYDFSSDVTERPASAWSCSMSVEHQDRHQRGALQSFLAGQGGRAGVFWLNDFSRHTPATGYQDTQFEELVDNGWPYLNTDNWTEQNNVDLRAMSSGWMRAQKLSTSGAGAGTFRVGWSADGNPASWHALALYFDPAVTQVIVTVRVAFDDDTDIITPTILSAGRNVFSFNMGSGAVNRSGYIEFSMGSSEPQDAFCYVTGVSMARVWRVNGAGQTGNYLTVTSMLSATEDVKVRAGTLLEVAGRLYQVRHDAYSRQGAGTGAETLAIDPPIFNSPANIAPIVLRYPAGLFRLSEDAAWSNAPGLVRSESRSTVDNWRDVPQRSSFAFSARQDDTRLDESLTIGSATESGDDVLPLAV